MLTRRKFFVGGAASTLVIGTSGCLLLGLFRLGARGALIRSGARAARVSRRGTLASFGRSGASTFQLLRLTRALENLNRMQRVAQMFRIEDPSETGVAAVDCNGEIAECTVDEVPVTSTRTDGRWLVHHSNLFREHVGVSLPTENLIKHEDKKGRLIGADIFEIDNTLGTIKHFNRNNALVGTTTYQNNQVADGTRAIIQDAHYLRSQLREASADVDVNHAEALRQMRRAATSQTACLERPAAADCGDLAARVSWALEKLEKTA